MNPVRETYSATDIAELRHGLRTPLNHIIGYVEMMHEDALQLGYADAANGLQQVLNEAQHICDLIQKHSVFSQRSITDADLDELRTELHQPVNQLRRSVAGLANLPVSNAITDLQRINHAI